MIKYQRYAKAMRMPSSSSVPSERGVVRALDANAASHIQAAREDRDGCSRYRAAKMPVMQAN